MSPSFRTAQHALAALLGSSKWSDRIIQSTSGPQFSVPGRTHVKIRANLTRCDLTLQQVDRFREVGDADMFGEGGVLALEGEEHFPGHTAIAEMAGRRRAKF